MANFNIDYLVIAGGGGAGAAGAAGSGSGGGGAYGSQPAYQCGAGGSGVVIIRYEI